MPPVRWPWIMSGEGDTETTLLSTGPQLKVVATMSVGYDHLDVAAIKARNIQIGYTPNVLTDATADLTVLLTLAAARRMKEVTHYLPNFINPQDVQICAR